MAVGGVCSFVAAGIVRGVCFRQEQAPALQRLGVFIRNRMLGAGRFFVVGEDIILPSWGAEVLVGGRGNPSPTTVETAYSSVVVADLRGRLQTIVGEAISLPPICEAYVYGRPQGYAPIMLGEESRFIRSRMGKIKDNR